MRIKRAVWGRERNDLDELLWSVLWQPLGLPRDVRRSFKLDGHEIELVAVDNGVIVGGIVANRLSGDEIELRHIAVRPGSQGKSVGSRLVQELIGRLRRDRPVRLHTWARNTSAGFFTRLGFQPTGEYLEHPDFSAHGIRFQKMRLEIPGPS